MLLLVAFLCLGATPSLAAPAVDPAACNCANQPTSSTIEHLKKALADKSGLMAKWDGVRHNEHVILIISVLYQGYLPQLLSECGRASQHHDI